MKRKAKTSESISDYSRGRRANNGRRQIASRTTIEEEQNEIVPSASWMHDVEDDIAATNAAVEEAMERPDHILTGLTCSSVPSPHEIVETENLRQLATKQLDAALQMLHVDDKVDLMTAMARVPHLVQKESDPMRFLRRENYDPWAAAVGLAKYWAIRRDVFGERALRPLTLTSESALDEESIASVEIGQPRILPNDSYGRSVAVANVTRRIHHSSTVRMQVCFYVGNVICENPSAQTKGSVLIIESSTAPRLDGAYLSTLRLLAHLPFRTCMVHICSCVSPKRQNFFSTVINPMLRRSGFLSFHRNEKLRTHVTDNRDDMCITLMSYGLRKEGLPLSLGGKWSFDDHINWLVERRRGDHCLFSNQPSPLTGALQSAADIVRICKEKIDVAMDEIPENEKAAYNNAVTCAAELVEKESALIQFLRSEDYHLYNASRRLVDYWRVRSHLFGERGVRLLSQTGEGALSQKDRDVLGTGFCVLLPSDKQERSVVAIDVAALVGDCPKLSIHCAMFYILSIAAENLTAQQDGVILLIHSSAAKISTIDIDLFRRIVLALPLQVAKVHLCGDTASLGEFVDYFNFGWKPLAHEVSRPSHLAKTLERYDIPASGLPKRFGGTWDFANFVDWQETRIRREWDLAVSAVKLAAFAGLEPRVVSTVQSDKERQRRLQVLRSRRKRDRLRIATVHLQEQICQLQEEQQAYINEQERLADLVKQAHAIAQLYQRS